ncbi:muconate cycloisomerase [Altererythrobacter xixiisoli]|uniref:Muconate cycloisomerase n=1 Tax=Croceibacterium xixiisoli TaxID=1476466 RepID=A0A6I4TUE1_9SPHN|nr:mandelate racemase/muconate lactonizing enzyme family protein [Croceibacterium xixiisoli]MXO99544.1 muconate cycloisomerase [Croceibacterium xixiisoli]
MKIRSIVSTPLRLPFRQPYHWAQGVLHAAECVLIEINTDEGIIGYGEVMAMARADATLDLIRAAADVAIGRDPLSINAILADIYQQLFASRGNLADIRFAATLLAGIDMALWDISGKAAGRPVHALIGGAQRDHLQYFGFPQGHSPEEIARDAARWVEAGCQVIYVKVGRGDALDRDIVRQVRGAIGDRRLRIDANEAWDVLTARRMIAAMAPYDVEFIEQPTPRGSLTALAAVRAHSPIPVAADQIAYTPGDVAQLCAAGAADLVVIGLHETGGFSRFLQCAAIAGAAGVNLCLHGLYESGISTCATLHAGAVIANLDDGNQYMNHFLAEDIITGPDLRLQEGTLPLLTAPGLGFDINPDAVARAAENYRQNVAG